MAWRSIPWGSPIYCAEFDGSGSKGLWKKAPVIGNSPTNATPTGIQALG